MMRHHRHHHRLNIVATAIVAALSSSCLSFSPLLPIASAFQNLIPPKINIDLPASIASLLQPRTNTPTNGGGGKRRYGDSKLEDRLLDAIASGGDATSSRLEISDEIADLVRQLEASQMSVPRPSIAEELYGRWKLLRTSNADTASPIQRKAVDASKYDIYQDILVVDDENENDDDGASSGGGRGRLVVSQIVEFGKGNRLCVDALASTSAYPLEELTERVGSGTILGFNVLGVSLIGDEAAEDTTRPDSRVRFVFDEGRFELFDGKLIVPYPVPFRSPLFRDAVKGWIDVTYLSDRVRISRGNKGTTFVLRKVD
jgi:hypothetical protein